MTRDQTFTELFTERRREDVEIIPDVQEMNKIDEDWARQRLREMVRSYISRITVAPHFHVCNGERPTASEDSPPAFYQHEAWPVREMVLDHVARVVEREIRS